MKNISQFLVVVGLFVAVLIFSADLCIAADQVENSIRFQLKEGSIIPEINLIQELVADKTTSETENLLANQRNAVVVEEKKCKEDEMLSLYFGEEHANCR